MTTRRIDSAINAHQFKETLIYELIADIAASCPPIQHSHSNSRTAVCRDILVVEIASYVLSTTLQCGFHRHYLAATDVTAILREERGKKVCPSAQFARRYSTMTPIKHMNDFGTSAVLFQSYFHCWTTSITVPAISKGGSRGEDGRLFR
jgi:hypothetical protein